MKGGIKPTFRDYLPVPSTVVKLSKKKGPFGSTETSVLNYLTPRNNPEKERTLYYTVNYTEAFSIISCLSGFATKSLCAFLYFLLISYSYYHIDIW